MPSEGCQAKNEPGLGGLGYMYANGASVERDPVRAYMWLELARTGADSGFTRELHARQRDERLALERREVRRLTRRFMEASTPATVDSMVMT